MSFDVIKKEVKTKHVDEVSFDKDGCVIEHKANKDSYAKVVYVDSKEYSYHIKVLDATLYDPLGTYSNRRKYLQAIFKKVSKATFDFYIMYLKTNNSLYFTKAQRGFLND